jgi:hypothetical protein
MIKEIKKKIKERFDLGSRPDFLIIGAQKAGTTSLFNYLLDYGENFVPPIKKELFYFSEHYDLPIRNYHSNFPTMKTNKVTGEATPDYLFFHQAPRIISEYNPDIKIVIILRNPTARAFSHYAHLNYTLKTHACDPLSFSEAIRTEESRFYIEKPTKFYHEYKYYSYKSRGVYINQIKNWLKYFDRKQFHIMFLEEFEKNIEHELLKLMDFLCIKQNSMRINAYIHNKGSSEITLLKEDKQYLDHFFREYNHELFDFLNKDYLWR